MGVRVKNASRQRRLAMVQRAVWDFIEGEVHQLDASVAKEVASKVCDAVGFVAQDMNNVAELNRIGMRRRHWYNLQLDIGEDRLELQNTLEGAISSSPQHPAMAQPRLYRTLISLVLDLFSVYSLYVIAWE